MSAAKRKKLELVGADLLLHGNDCVETEMHGRCSTIYDRLGLLEKEQVGRHLFILHHFFMNRATERPLQQQNLDY